jgi:hypothetical protein
VLGTSRTLFFFLQELLNIVLEFKGRSFGGVSLIRLTVVIYQDCIIENYFSD